MVKEVSIIVLPEDEKNNIVIGKKILKSLSLKAPLSEIKFSLLKRSVDARHGNVKLCLRFKVFTGKDKELFEGEGKADSPFVPKWKDCRDSKITAAIVGSGPAGLFGALKFLELGIRPVIFERGQKTDERRRDIAAISTKKVVDEDSNYCFGEGGAGTFSDGKLYTRSNKRGDISSILKIFNYFGADKKILTDAHPHIGTDKLPAIISAMREKIISLGGEFHFNTKVTDLVIENGKVKGVKTSALKENSEGGEIGKSGENLANGEHCGTFLSDIVLLATGHSATDIYEMMARTAPSSLEAKTFAVGVRLEHPRALIDAIQYHGKNLGTAAEYRVTSQVDGRGVYSFCMCPGGFVVPSATEKDGIVVNGMSAAGRNSVWSNAAIVVETRPEDIPEDLRKKAKESGCEALAGLFFRRHIEQLTFKNGDGQKAPAQIMTDFIDGKDSHDFPKTSYTPGIVASRLDKWLPSQISDRLREGFKKIDSNMKGFICKDAVMIASETRTSTPVRILRDKETFECTVLKGLFPCGEGSGYSGGIVSSAMDGENAAICAANLALHR